MGIFKRIKNIATADINNALDKCEDPVSMLKQYLREMEEEIQKAQAALSNQLYLEKKYHALVTETQGLIEKRIRQSDLAVERNQDDIAKLAIQEKFIHEKKLKGYQHQFEIIKAQTSHLTEQIKQLKDKYEEFQAKKQLLISRAEIAQVSNNIATTMVSFNPENAVKGFARMEYEILKLEAKAQASQYFAQPQAPQKFSADFDEEVEKELARIKESKNPIA